MNEASIVLRNEGGKYNSDLAGNFWETNGLNAGGFQNAVKIYTEHLSGIDGNWIENLLFTGLINESFEPIGEATFKMSCVDISSRLRKALAQDFRYTGEMGFASEALGRGQFRGDIHTGTVVVADADRDRYGAERSHGSGNQSIGVAERGTGRAEHRLHDTDGAQDSGRVF